MTLAEFLTARIADDEATANATVEPHSWHNEHLALHGRLLAADQAHIARHDPARVLREVEAMRVILAAYVPVAKADGVDEYEYAYGWATGLGTALRALGAVYSDHPDYDPAWKA